MRGAWRSCARWVGARSWGRVLLGALLFSVAALLGAPGAGSGAATSASEPAAPGRELSQLRTASSDTFEGPGGTRVVRVYARPINYLSASAGWQPINDELVSASDGTLHPAASGMPVSLPASLAAGGVSVGAGKNQLSLQLQGASSAATAQAAGSSVTYKEVLESTSATYSVSPSAVREALSLQDAGAPSTYTYALGLGSALHAKLSKSSGVAVLDAGGREVYWIAPPTVRDASIKGMPLVAPVHYELSPDGNSLSVVLDRAWLESAERVFPVTIDPDIYHPGDEEDCLIANGSYANTSLCGNWLYVGSEGATAQRSLLHFETPYIPTDSKILDGRMQLFFNSRTSTETKNVEIYGLEHEFTSAATWNTYNGANAWSSPGGGGDTGKQPIPGGGSQLWGERSVTSAMFGDYVAFGMTPLVEQWVHTPSSNHGIMIKAQNETSGYYDTFLEKYSEHPPYMEVTYTPQIGAPSDATFTGTKLSDRAGLSVNVANGNLLVQNGDLDLPGVGYDFSLANIYNNLGQDANEEWREWPEYSERLADKHLLRGTVFSSGSDVSLERVSTDESRVYHDPSGAWWTFIREPSADSAGNKAYLSPAGLSATLQVHEAGTATLTYNTAQVKYEFNAEGSLEKIVDQNGNTTKFHYNAEGKTSSVEDTEGHTLTYTYEGTNGDLSKITDALGRQWRFSEDSSNRLTLAEDPDGHELKYAYNSEGNLSQLTDPRGNLIELSYNSSGKVTQIRRVVNGTATTAGSEDVISTFAYAIPASESAACPAGSIGDTTVVSPNGSTGGVPNNHTAGHSTTYCFNAEDQVTKAVDQAGNPSKAEYDAATGRLSSYQNPGDSAGGATGVQTTLAYNSQGAVTNIVRGTGTSSSLETVLSYTGGFHEVEPGTVLTPRSAKGQTSEGHTTFYGYDTNGNVSSVRQGVSTEGHPAPEVKLIHNSLGQVTESTDGDGNTTKYEYNASHQLAKIVPPSPSGIDELGPTELTYDSVGRIHTVKDGRAITSTYSYDGEDRVTKVEYSDGSKVSFEYDADGNTVKRTDASGFGEPYTGITTYEYDKLNRPAHETTPTAKTDTYGYDYDGNLTSLKDGGGTVSYAYGPNDVLTSLIEPENSSKPFTFTYESGNDNREATTYPNGLLQCTKTDPAGRLKSLIVFKPSVGQNCASTITPSATLEDYELSYIFKEGEISIDTPDLQLLKDLKASKETSYEYDTLDRLLKATLSGSPARVSEYEYDNAGNMKLNHTYTGETTYTNEHMKYNVANEICAIATTTPSACASPTEPGIAGQPTYDKDGNMTSDGLLGGANKFAYTTRNQLSSITPHGESAKAVVSHGTGQDDLAAIGSEEVITNILGVGVTGSGESAKYYTLGSEGTLLAKRTAKGKPSETEYFEPDAFGSVALLSNSTGAQIAPASGVYQYDSYGQSLSERAQFNYRGGFSVAAGLVHYGARYYEPILGAWTQQDPLDHFDRLGEADRYTFVADDPINASDPAGLCSSVIHCLEDAVDEVAGGVKILKELHEGKTQHTGELVEKLEPVKDCYEGGAEAHEEFESGLKYLDLGAELIGCVNKTFGG
jgi:RHS repeat-associated protein